MTYKEFIDDIITKRGRFLYDDIYYERHHIIPKCCGGSNDIDNMIDLFADEHYKAHRLLALENPNNDKLQFAWWQMCHCKKDGRDYEISAEDYAMAREAHARAISEQTTMLWANPDSRAKIQNSLTNTKTRQKMSESAKKRYNTPEGRAHIQEMWTVERKTKVSKQIVQYTKDGEFVAEFFGAREASRVTGIVYSSIAECASGKRKSAGGFVWKYKK